MNDIFENNIAFDLDNDDDLTFDVPGCLNDPMYDKFIVRLYRKEKHKNTWCGIGVIVGEYLVTVAHVLMAKNIEENYSILYFEFEKQIKQVNFLDIVFDGRDGLYESDSGIYHDLLVFKLVGINSPFKLNINSEKTPIEVYAWTYDEYSSQIDKHKIVMQTGYKQKSRKRKLDENLELRNCLTVTGKFINGNSGTPIFRNNIIYGILIGRIIENYPDEIIKPLLNDGDKIYNFLDARYIQEMISKTVK